MADKTPQISPVGDVSDQWVICRPSLGGKNTLDSPRVKGVRPQPVNRFRGEGNQPPAAENTPCFLDNMKFRLYGINYIKFCGFAAENQKGNTSKDHLRQRASFLLFYPEQKHPTQNRGLNQSQPLVTGNTSTIVSFLCGTLPKPVSSAWEAAFWCQIGTKRSQLTHVVGKEFRLLHRNGSLWW